MGYHNVRLPTVYSQGSLFGPGFKTEIVETDGGSEVRIQRYPPAGRRRYNLSRGIDGLDSLMTLHQFYLARGGAENSFRVKDWLDYATTPTWTTHRDEDNPVSNADVHIYNGDGVTTTYQLYKRYTDGPTTVNRTIRKPVSGTVVVALNGISTSAFSVDYETGVLTFSPAPADGDAISFGCEFDVPGRFSKETDDALQIAIQALEAGDLPEIVVIEDLDPVTVSQDRDYGGAIDHGTISVSTSVSELNGKMQSFTAGVAGVKLVLPDVTNMELGGPIFALKNNSGSNSALLRNNADTTTIATIGANLMVQVYLGLVGTTKTWLVY